MLLGKLWISALEVGEMSVKETVLRAVCEAGYDTGGVKDSKTAPLSRIELLPSIQ